VSQQDPVDSAAQRREVVIATLATAVHRWHRQRIRVGARAVRAASIAMAELQGPGRTARARLVYGAGECGADCTATQPAISRRILRGLPTAWFVVRSLVCQQS
jgi:hypothetical protein